MMEIIAIDDSIDEIDESDRREPNCAAAASLTAAAKARTVTPREISSSRTASNGDDGGWRGVGGVDGGYHYEVDGSQSSASSADSIWIVEVGPPAKARGSGIGGRMMKESVIRTSKSNEGEVLVGSSDRSRSSSNIDEVHCRPPASSASSLAARPTNKCFDDGSSSSSSSSSVSSNDSIWLKTGLKQKWSGQEGIADVEEIEHLDNDNYYIGNETTGLESAAQQLRIDSTKDDAPEYIESDKCDNDYGSSSISSTDSIWDIVGLPSSKENASGASCISDCRKSIGYLGAIGESKVLDATKCDDSSSVSSCDSLWNEEGLFPSRGKSAPTTAENDCGEANSCVIGTALPDDNAGQNCVVANDGSSQSSNDSIWDEKGLPSRVRAAEYAPRVVTYYDYLRLQQKQKARDRLGSEDSTANDKTRKINGRGHAKTNGNEKHSVSEISPPPEVSPPVGATWEIFLLMDHREFGCANNFLQTVEVKINKHFGRKCAEITTLPSADYLYVARLISHETGEVLDERVLDMVIERKNVADVCSCLVTNSKKYKPLSFFEAQMYKLQTCGVGRKLFLMEGDEDRTKSLLTGAKSKVEKERRLKRVKTLRLQLKNGEFEGVELICTRNRTDTVKYLVNQMAEFEQSFDPRRPPSKTREQLKLHIEKQMTAPTFCEYLRLRKIPGIGDAKAMKVIMDQNLHWNKSFISPCSSKESKSKLEDRATFWRPPPMK